MRLTLSLTREATWHRQNCRANIHTPGRGDSNPSQLTRIKGVTQHRGGHENDERRGELRGESQDSTNIAMNHEYTHRKKTQLTAITEEINWTQAENVEQQHLESNRKKESEYIEEYETWKVSKAFSDGPFLCSYLSSARWDKSSPEAFLGWCVTSVLCFLLVIWTAVVDSTVVSL